MTERVSVPRWDVGIAVALVAGSAGLLASNATMFTAAVVGIGYAVYGYATKPPEAELAVERTVEPTSPLPGATVDVSVSVMNVGETIAPEVRIVDTVPRDLEVIDGTPRHCTSLEPGEEVTVEYALRARRGEHDFGPISVVSRNVSGTGEQLQEAADGETITARATVDPMALEDQTTDFAGRVATDAGGDGLEFYETRQYHPTDPMKRVDWKRFARTNELTTIEFREERAATVVVVVDVREKCDVARDELGATGVELSTYAGGRILAALLDDNNLVGLAEFGGTRGYLPPATGRDQVARAERLLAAGPDAVAEARRVTLGVGRGGPLSQLRERMPDDAQVVFVTPVPDDVAVRATNWLEAAGHEVTVVSPDLTDPDRTGGLVAHVDRQERLREVREGRSRVVEWTPTEPLHAAVARAERRWSG